MLAVLKTSVAVGYGHMSKAQQITRVSSSIYTNSIIELILNRFIFNFDKRWSLLISNYNETSEGDQRQLKFFKENYKIENKSNKSFILFINIHLTHLILLILAVIKIINLLIKK